MKMGKGIKNSSITYVHPAFAEIKNHLPVFFDWLNMRCGNKIPVEGIDWASAIVKFADKQGRGEQGLPASRGLLKWMVCNAATRRDVLRFYRDPEVSSESNQNRSALFDSQDAHHDKVLAVAINKLNLGKRSGWFILEGASKPDVYIETGKFILVVEGKRTEPKRTETTKFFLKGRDQLIRHMDSAMEVAGGKPVFGLFITEKDYAVDCYEDVAYFKNAMPHRTEEECLGVMGNLLPQVKWDSLRKELNERGIVFNYKNSTLE